MPRLVFSTAAQEDLAEIEARIEEASSSNESAQSFVELLVGKCHRLAGYEKVGRPRPELLPDLRSFPYRNYVIFFRYVADGFYVVNVLHGSRDIDAYFADVDGDF